MPERWTPHAGFKQRVAKYYGLQGPSGDESKLVDMLGVTRDAKDVTLAHLFPASYDTFGTIASELALPANFHKDCRSFLLLPRELHTVFDSGIIGFIPSRDRIIIRVLKPAATLSPELGVVDGTPLYTPEAPATGTGRTSARWGGSLGWRRGPAPLTATCRWI